jgi:uncharacterized protein (TIGR00725 family)
MASVHSSAKKVPNHVRHSLKYKICVSGAAQTGHCTPGIEQVSENMGRLIAERGMVLVTGATVGVPYYAAKGAKEAGGIVIGLSPAASEAAHLKTYHLPIDYHDLIIYTGFEYSGRNLLLTRSSDAVITMCGRMGTLNEFTIAYEDKKPLGVLLGTGGITDAIEDIIKISRRGMGNTVLHHDPEKLLDTLIAMIGHEKERDSEYEERFKGVPRSNNDHEKN